MGKTTEIGPGPVPSWTAADGWISPRAHVPSWAGTATWSPPARRVSWEAAVAWRPTLDRLVVASAQALESLLATWDARLGDLGGDPGRDDWTRFRPLRLSREEDWSDWLGHLLEHARSGRFPARLFGASVQEAERWQVARAEREVTAEGYRADLVVRFRDGDWIHVEVKTGDQDLEKTPGTGAALQRLDTRRCRANFLLLPDHDARRRSAELEEFRAADGIATRTWGQVARALRNGLSEADAETASWRVWARAFLGAVEQRLLGFRAMPAKAQVALRRPDAHDIEHLEYLRSLEAS